MINNNTKDKGDFGLISVIRDLASKNIKTCLPVSEHLPFDLIAVNEVGQLLKVSVKFTKLIKGSIPVRLQSVYSNTKGSFAKTVDFNLIDCIAVYCPDTDKCYYVNVNEIKGHKALFYLRPTEFIQRKTHISQMHIAENYLEIESFFGR